MITKKKFRYWVNRLSSHQISKSAFVFPNKCGSKTLITSSKLKRMVLKRARKALRKGKWKCCKKGKKRGKKKRKRIHFIK